MLMGSSTLANVDAVYGLPLRPSSKDGRLDSRVRGNDGLKVTHYRSLRVVRTASTSR